MTGFLGVSAWTLAKGSTGFLYTDELHFWLNTYRPGLVRRGLIGSLLAPVMTTSGQAQVLQAAILCHVFGLLLLVWLASTALRRCMGQSPGPRGAMCGLLFATSPFLGELALHVGYPDSLICDFILAAGLGARRLAAPGRAAVLVVAALMHELCFLLLAPVLVFSSLTEARRVLPDLAWIMAGCAASCLLVISAVPPAADVVHTLEQAGLSPNDAAAQATISLHQGIGTAFAAMLAEWRVHPLNGLAGLVYGGLPGIGLMLLFWPLARQAAGRMRPPGWRGVITGAYLASGLGGLALLLLGWDLSRLASFTTLTAFLTVSMLPADAAVAERAGLARSLAAIPLAFVVMPVCSLYFDYGRIVNTKRVSALCAPCAEIAVAGLDVYNRGLRPAAIQAIDHDSRFGN